MILCETSDTKIISAFKECQVPKHAVTVKMDVYLLNDSPSQYYWVLGSKKKSNIFSVEA